MIDIVCVAYSNYKLIKKTIKHTLSLSDNFRMFICDNTPILHRDKHFLPSIESSRVKTFDFIDKSDYDGENHGAALDFLVAQTETEIIGTLDHDFFWIMPDIYNWVIDSFEIGYKALGAEGWYPNSDWKQSIDQNHPERGGGLAPVCWGQFVLKEVAIQQTFITARNEGPWGYETGWRLRKQLIDTGAKVRTIPGFQYENQKDELAGFFGTPRVPVGLHLLKGINRDLKKENDLINDLIILGTKEWVEDK